MGQGLIMRRFWMLGRDFLNILLKHIGGSGAETQHDALGQRDQIFDYQLDAIGCSLIDQKRVPFWAQTQC